MWLPCCQPQCGRCQGHWATPSRSNVLACRPTASCWSSWSWWGGDTDVPGQVSRAPWRLSISSISACSWLATTCRAPPSSVAAAPTCADLKRAGNFPVCSDKLASVVIAGAKTSTQSFSRETGRTSSGDVLRGMDASSFRTSSIVTGWKFDVSVTALSLYRIVCRPRR